MRAEMGIHEADVMLGRRLTDRDAEASVRALVHELRSALEQPGEQVEAARDRDVIVWNIKRNWEDLFAKQPRHSRAELAGLLGVVLESMSKWRGPGLGPRAYLNYIEGFLGSLGVRVISVPLEGELDEDE